MHVDEADTDASLVGRLLAAQFPRWANLPLQPLHSGGTDNAIYRLGDDMAVRLPRIQTAALQADKEHRWLPRFAPLLQRIDPAGGPPPGPHNFFRGEPLINRDARTRAAIASLHGNLDIDALTAAWEAALRAPAWRGAPVWIHGDLQSGNLLARQGQLSAVIDFGGLGVGDPACDLMVAWNLFSAESRDVFRAALQVDDATWARGRGWAISVGLIALPYYESTNPMLAGISRYAINEVLADR